MVQVGISNFNPRNCLLQMRSKTKKNNYKIFCRDFPNAPYVGYYKVLSPGIIVRDPDLVKEVLIKDHFSFHVNEQDFSKRFDPLMQYNPFVAAHEGWRKSRTVLTPLLTLYKVRQLHPLTVDTCNKMADFLKCLPTNKDVEAKSVSG